MTVRYKLRALDATDEAMQVLQEIRGPDGATGFFINGTARPWKAVFEHIKRLGTRTLLIQYAVRDPDYLGEHRAFYAQQHKDVQRTCIRVHAFSVDAPVPPANDVVSDHQIVEFIDAVVERNQQYLGFVTLRPLRHAPVGPTILVSLAGSRVCAFDGFWVHIAGNTFKVAGTPFLQQDNAVGACAQASIWMALRTLQRRAGNAAYSPAELTIAATRYLASNRVFPGRDGLAIEQMLEAIRFAGHDPLRLQVKRPGAPSAVASDVLEKAMPYIESGLPVILALSKGGSGHAIVAVGVNVANAPAREISHVSLSINFASASDWASSLVVHNDNSGPYLSFAGHDPAQPQPYCLEHAVSLIVPLPDGVFSTAAEAEDIAVKGLYFGSATFSALAEVAPRKQPEIPFVLRTYLCPRHVFRRWAKNAPELDATLRDIYRTSALPQYVWVTEIHDQETYDPTNPAASSRCGEVVLDASADAFHGDSVLFVRLIADLYPTANRFQAVVLQGGSWQTTPLATGARGPGLYCPWDEAD